MNLDRLRSETRPEHLATEAVMPRLDGVFGRAEYVGLLVGMYRAVRRWDEWAEVWAPADLRELVRTRRRGPALEQDLEFFGVSSDGASGSSGMERTFRGAGSQEERRAAFLGMMYVVEGSRLGGQWIARRAEEVLGLEAGEGDAFFRGAGTATGERWREFRAVLGAVPDEYEGVVIRAARDMFGFFRECLAGVVV